MMKTADEIKKGLKCYSDQDGCAKICDVRRCPYADVPSDVTCGEIITKHALAYIQQLEAERDAAVTCIGKLMVILKTYPYAATNCCAYEAYKEIKKYIETVRGVQEEG